MNSPDSLHHDPTLPMIHTREDFAHRSVLTTEPLLTSRSRLKTGCSRSTLKYRENTFEEREEEKK
jgi:hypothetical protein